MKQILKTLFKILPRRREKNLAQQANDQNDSYLKNPGGHANENTNEIKDHWEEAIQVLKQSNLKKLGNPLYVLPWYLIIGDRASGKTTAIKSAKLSPLLTDSSRNSCISGTRHCDWWFFEQAIILDIPGRFVIPHEEKPDKDEWHKFLSLLIKFRKKEPINGLIVTVAADKLINPVMKILTNEGRDIRRCVDELMRFFGTKFPIYLLVTKCDLIQGMTQFCSNLSEKNLDQAMGLLNQEMSSDVMAFHERAVRTIGSRLRDLRLLIFQRFGPKKDPEFLLFPEEFEQIKPGLDRFIESAFQENSHQETPLLRGIFFSSGRQEGKPYSYFMNSLGLIEEREVLPGTNRGLFLKDFFSKILPEDRRLFNPTQKVPKWGQWTTGLALTSWMAIAIVVCGLLSFSFFKTLSTLKNVNNDLKPPPVLKGEIFTDVVTMDRFRRAILNIEGRNTKWWIPHFWLTDGLEIEKNIKEQYCIRFRDGLLVPFDKHLSDRISSFSTGTSDEILGRHALHIVRRINLLKARLEGMDPAGLGKKPQPFFDTIVVSAHPDILPELTEQFNGLYLFNLSWQDDTSRLSREMNTLQSQLKHLLDLRPNKMHWLVTWINKEPAVSDIMMENFWGNNLSSIRDYSKISDEIPEKKREEAAIISEATVHRAFTSSGKKMIDAFIQEMEEALPDPILIASRKAEFEGWYKESYLNEWYEFGKKFPKDISLISAKEELQQTASIMATDRNPYFDFLDTLAEELEPFYGGFFQDKNLSAWADLVIEFHIIRSQVENNPGKGGETLKDSGIVGRTINKVKAKITTPRQETGLDEYPEESELIRTRMSAAKAYEQYKNALQEIGPVAFSRLLAFEMTGAVFENDPTSRTSPFFTAQNAVQVMKAIMTGTRAEQPMFWELVQGPWEFLWEYATQETSCKIKSLWEEEVLGEVREMSDINRMANSLVGQDGLATKFISGPAKPFVGRDSNNSYYAKEVFGKKIPFEDSFFNFMTQGALVVQSKREETRQRVQSNYSVNIRGLPTDANFEAQMKPHATNLIVKCGNQNYSLVNLNYPVQKTINWSPETCEDVVFSIEVGNLILTRKYKGSDAFPRFLQDFSPGTRIFYSKDFPQNQSALNQLGITYIGVNYQFKNHEPVISLLKKVEKRPRMPDLPKNIVQCRDQ